MAVLCVCVCFFLFLFGLFLFCFKSENPVRLRAYAADITMLYAALMKRSLDEKNTYQKSSVK